MIIKNLMDILSKLPQDTKIEAVFRTSYGHEDNADIVGVDVQFLSTGATRVAIRMEETKEEDSSFDDEGKAA